MDPKGSGLALELDLDGCGSDGVNHSGDIPDNNAGPDDWGVQDLTLRICGPEDMVAPTVSKQITDDPSFGTPRSDVIVDANALSMRPMCWHRVVTGPRNRPVDDLIPLNDEDRDLPPSCADASFFSFSFDSRASSDESDDEDMFVKVEQTKRAKKAKVKVRPDPPGFSLSDEKSLRRLRKKCGISKEIVLVAPSLADRADAPPPRYMTLFENYFDQCLLWFPLPCFLMRFLAVHGVCLAQINPRGIKHLLGIYVLSREYGVVISTEHLSYLTDFRVRCRSEELKHTVTNLSGMALIAEFPSKNDHFEDRFFFVEISERTVEADCIDIVKTRWERTVKPSLPEVSKEFVTTMHTELSSGNGNRRKSFSRRRIERELSAEIFPAKILGRSQARVSFREQAALEAAAKAKGSSGTNTPRVVAPMTSTSTAPLVRARLLAERARISSGKGKGVDRETPSKRQRVDTYHAAVVGRETLASHVGGLLHDEAYSALSLFFDRQVSDYDEDVGSTDSKLGTAKEANAVLQSRLDEFAERNEVLERGALSLQKVKKDYDDKLAKLKLRCTKPEGEVVQLRGELSSTSDLQRSRIDDVIAEAKDEMARGFAEQASEVVGVLAEIGRKAQNDMLNLAEIDANLEFIGLLQGSEPPDLPTEVKALHEWRHPIYDAHDVFVDLLAIVRRVLDIHVVSAGAAEASVPVDDEVSDKDDVEVTDNDDVEVSDEDDVEVPDDDEDAED
ncbi:hypothetical protein AALP_AA7G055600 [Arabis alpina]|uniref:DUF1204 domain-containing protein n=1 Tax=Arabis alpina TaxID=50452 RepID=A0A087GG37_ARAAL|nr:hypothetical protein AALP_AA7G055600 [Arabis alpina]